MALSLQNAGAPALISLTSFGNAEVRRHGQLYFARLSHAAGVNGFEVREELLIDAAQELPALAAFARDQQLDVVYSCPQPLFAMDGQLDTAKVKAFRVPAGTAVEVYGTTLHYAPCQTAKTGFRVAVVLPKGTNTEKPAFEPQSEEDIWMTARNKWLLAHPDSGEAKSGAHIGLTGKNIDITEN